MIRNVVFDMGNVLIQFDAFRYIQKVTQDPEDTQILFNNVFATVEWIQGDRGGISDEDMARKICGRLPERLHGPARRLLEEWVEDIPLVPGMEEVVADVKAAGYQIYLLSNTCKRYHKFRELIPALQYFDGEFISADWNLIKPEMEFYRAFFAHFGLVAGECLFIDDSPVNIEAAIRAGMEGYVFHGEAAELRKYLTENLEHFARVSAERWG